jgi:hypothetical protein
MTTQNESGAPAKFFGLHQRARIEAPMAPIIPPQAQVGGKVVGTIKFLDPSDPEFIHAKPDGAVASAQLPARLSPG